MVSRCWMIVEKTMGGGGRRNRYRLTQLERRASFPMMQARQTKAATNPGLPERRCVRVLLHTDAWERRAAIAAWWSKLKLAYDCSTAGLTWVSSRAHAPRDSLQAECKRCSACCQAQRIREFHLALTTLPARPSCGYSYTSSSAKRPRRLPWDESYYRSTHTIFPMIAGL